MMLGVFSLYGYVQVNYDSLLEHVCYVDKFMKNDFNKSGR